MTLELGSIEGITLTCFARPPFSFPTKKPLQNNIGKEKDKYYCSVTQVECR